MSGRHKFRAPPLFFCVFFVRFNQFWFSTFLQRRKASWGQKRWKSFKNKNQKIALSNCIFPFQLNRKLFKLFERNCSRRFTRLEEVICGSPIDIYFANLIPLVQCWKWAQPYVSNSVGEMRPAKQILIFFRNWFSNFVFIRYRRLFLSVHKWQLINCVGTAC